MTPPSIAFLLGDYSTFGGVERVTAALIDLFNAANLNCRNLISVYGDFGNSHIHYSNEAKLSILAPGEKKCSSIPEKLSSVLKKNNIDILIFPGNNVTFSNMVLQAADEARCRAIPMFHGSIYASLTKHISKTEIKERPKLLFSSLLRKIQLPWKKRRLYKMLSRCHGGVITVSHGCKNELYQLFPKLQDTDINIQAIPNPLPFAIPTGYDSLLNEKDNIIVYAGRLERTHKNAFMIIKTWQLIAHQFPKWRLNVLGEGSLRAKMQDYVNQHSIPGITFEGFVENMEERFRQSAISVLTSDYEGLSMVFVESALYKNALVSTRSYGGVSDIVEDGTTGLFVNKHDAVAMAKAISKLIEDQTLREKLAENAANRVVQLCAPDTVLASWQDFLSIPHNTGTVS